MVIQQAITIENSDKKPIKKVGAPKESTESITAAAVEAYSLLKVLVEKMEPKIKFLGRVTMNAVTNNQNYRVIRFNIRDGKLDCTPIKTAPPSEVC